MTSALDLLRGARCPDCNFVRSRPEGECSWCAKRAEVLSSASELPGVIRSGSAPQTQDVSGYAGEHGLSPRPGHGTAGGQGTTRAATDAPEQSAWRPISAAPRDGTVVLLLCPKGAVVEGAWEQVDGGGHPENGPPIYWWVSPFIEFIDGPYDAPTHWQPLPMPPEAP